MSIVKALLLTCFLQSANAEQIKEIFLSKGEQSEISISNLESFSIGNKEVLKAKYFAARGKIIFKAKSIGFSDVLISTKAKSNQKYQFFITSKRAQLKKMEVAAALKKNGFEIRTFGEVISVSGKVKNLSEYLIFKELTRELNEKIVTQIVLTPTFIKEFIARIYQDFYDAKFDYINCEVITTNIYCQYQGKEGHKSLIDYYQDKFFVTLNPLQVKTNLKLSLQFVWVKSHNASINSSGLKGIQASLQKALSSKKLYLESGDILLQNEDFDAVLVASPSISILSNEKFHLSLGSEIPLHQVGPQSTQTIFKFSGLKFSGEVKSEHRSFYVKYSLEVTQSENNIFSGPRGKSSFMTSLNKAKEILFLNLSEKNSQKQNIPWINQVPILGKLLSRHQGSKGQMYLKVFAKLEEE